MPYSGGGIGGINVNMIDPSTFRNPGQLSPFENPYDLPSSSLAPYTDYSDLLKPMSDESYNTWIAENPEFHQEIMDSLNEEYGQSQWTTDDVPPLEEEEGPSKTSSGETEREYKNNENVFKFNANDWISQGKAQDMLSMVQAILNLINDGDVSNLYKVGGCMLTIVQFYFKSRNHKIQMNEIMESDAGKALKKGIQSRFVTQNSAQLTQFEKDLQEKTPQNFEQVKTKFYEDLTEQNMGILEEILNRYLTRVFDIQRRKEKMDSAKQEKLVKDAQSDFDKESKKKFEDLKKTTLDGVTVATVDITNAESLLNMRVRLETPLMVASPQPVMFLNITPVTQTHLMLQ